MRGKSSNPAREVAALLVSRRGDQQGVFHQSRPGTEPGALWGFGLRMLSLLVLLSSGALGGCESASDGAPPRSAGDEVADSRKEAILRELRRFEEQRREAADFSQLPAAQGRFGADPYALAVLKPGRIAGLLRGSSELVLLDEELRELSRTRAPAGARAMAVREVSEVGNPSGPIAYVAGEFSSTLWTYSLEGDRWRRGDDVSLPGVYAVNGLATRGDRLLITEEDRGRLLELSEAVPGEPVLRELLSCLGPKDIVVRGQYALVNCVLDHQVELLLFTRDEPSVVARIRHDGPIWGVDFVAGPNAVWLALGGVEDHPLDRTIGSFGYVDSYASVYRVVGRQLDRIATRNLSKDGVITPKSVIFRPRDGQREQREREGSVRPPPFIVAGYGGSELVELALDGSDSLRLVQRLRVGPGIAAGLLTAHGMYFANPLTDQWLRLAAGQRTVSQQTRSEPASARLGEALFFTQLMAPWNRSDGALSRFTCETCHFEGYVDGRTHHTGRQQVHATTKPLVGLFNNRPHFSRALDRDLSQVAHAEFRVAGAGSEQDPVFSLSRVEHPLLGELDLPETEYDAVALRQALMDFLMRLTHRTNPRVVGRSAFTAEERRGAELFRDACERCHAARFSTDAESRQPFERWERFVFRDNGPLVWASTEYRKVGIEPYVHSDGCRTPSLRRLYKKRPYFTNGSASSLEQVLEGVRLGETFSHAGGAGPALTPRQQTDLLAFLRLL